MMIHNLVLYFGELQEVGLEIKVDTEQYSYLMLLSEIFNHIGTRYVNLTIRCGNGMIIKDDNDLMRMFASYKGTKEISLYIEQTIIDPTLAIVMPPGWNIGEGNFNQNVCNEVDEGLGNHNVCNESDKWLGGNQNVCIEDDEGLGMGRGRRIGKEPAIERIEANDREEKYGDNDDDIIGVENDDISMGPTDVYLFSDSDDHEWINDEDTDSSSDKELNNEHDEVVAEDDDSEDSLFVNYNSDASIDPISSDDEGAIGVRTRRFDARFKGSVKPFTFAEGGKIVFELGQVFESGQKFRDMLRNYSIQGGYNLHRSKNEPKRITAHCLGEGCSWRIHASITTDDRTFMIKTLRPLHTCVRTSVQTKNANSTWIAKTLASQLRADPNMSYNLMQETLSKDFGVNPHHMQMYRAKRKSKELTEGKHSQSYSYLPRYAEMLRESNPGTVVKIELWERYEDSVDPPLFKRIFICYDAMKKGFLQGCRPFIGLDGCHLKGPYGGVLLSAISVDGNKGLFPIAFAVVEVECKDSWRFFLQYLYSCIGGGTKERPLVVMSDQQKGLSEVVAEIFPNSRHRFCARHMYANFRKSFPGLDLRLDFWAAVRAYDNLHWKQAMDAMKNHEELAWKYMMKLRVSTWARHAFHSTPKSDHTTNNMTESFNHWVGKFRNMPILLLLESIRMKLMSFMNKRYCKASSWTSKVTPSTRHRLDEILEEARHCILLPASREEYQVLERGKKYAVNLRNRTCSCNEWNITGLPCRHVACSLGHTRENIEDYCHDYFSVNTYQNAYNHIIHPIPEVNLDPRNDSENLRPPPLKRLPGRPRINRRREAGEPAAKRRSTTVRCSNCQDLGHNSRSCQRAPVAKKRKIQRQPGQSQAKGGQASNQAPIRGRGQVANRGINRGKGQATGQVAGRGTYAPRSSSSAQAPRHGGSAHTPKGNSVRATPSSQYAPIKGRVQWFSTQQTSSAAHFGVEQDRSSQGHGRGLQPHFGSQESNTGRHDNMI